MILLNPARLIRLCTILLGIFMLSAQFAPQEAQATTIEVNTTGDTGAPVSACTLRDAILTINAGSNQFNGCSPAGVFGTDDKITFHYNVAARVIELDDGLTLYVSKDLSINGLGFNDGRTTIDANNLSRVLTIIGPVTVQLNDLILTGGLATSNKGGGVYVPTNASLRLNNAEIRDSTAQNGGGVYTESSASLTLNNRSRISNNSATINGGGVYLGSKASLTLDKSKISKNSATMEGGGYTHTGM